MATTLCSYLCVMNDDELTTNVTFVFSYKTVWEHFVGIFSAPVQIIAIAAGCFGSIWTIYEATIASFTLTPNRLIQYLSFLAISIAISMAWRIYHYVNACPDGLEKVSHTARRIAHLQRPLWEFRFAKSVLAELLGPIDGECRNLLDGKVFVLAERRRDVREYYCWLAGRPENMLRMCGIARELIVIDFPKALASTKVKTACPKKILDVSLAIQRVYKEALNYERSSLAILPPEGFERLHKLQVGWSQPIRDAIVQLFDFLQQICDLDYRRDSRIAYTIDFGECPNVDEYCHELDLLGAKLPQIIENEW